MTLALWMCFISTRKCSLTEMCQHLELEIRLQVQPRLQCCCLVRVLRRQLFWISMNQELPGAREHLSERARCCRLLTLQNRLLRLQAKDKRGRGVCLSQLAKSLAKTVRKNRQRLREVPVDRRKRLNRDLLKCLTQLKSRNNPCK